MKPVLLVLSWLVGLALATAGRAEVNVVEYYHSGFGHYFITANPAEAALIDSRPPALALWSRTGLAFRAYAAPGAPDAPAGAWEDPNAALGQEPRVRLANMLPPLARWCRVALEASPNELIDVSVMLVRLFEPR